MGLTKAFDHQIKHTRSKTLTKWRRRGIEAQLGSKSNPIRCGKVDISTRMETHASQQLVRPQRGRSSTFAIVAVRPGAVVRPAAAERPHEPCLATSGHRQSEKAAAWPHAGVDLMAG
jgi:hypothetical protein